MDKLAGYGSDDDYDDSPKHRKPEHATSYDYRNKVPAQQVDVNYEEVQMELSEDSNSDSSRGDGQSNRDSRSNSKSSRNSDRRDNGRDDDRHSRDSPKYRDYKSSKRDDDEDRYRSRDDRKDDRDRYRSRNRDDKYSREKHRDDKSKSYRPSRRSSSRERRSRSPRKSDYRGKRSSSRDRDTKPSYVRKYERSFSKPMPEKPVIPNKPIEQPNNKPEPDKDRFYMPGITGRFKEQIERRKLLWQKKDVPEKRFIPAAAAAATATAAAGSTTGKVWQTTTFAQDTDGKVASKFKRLMGIKESSDGPKGTTDVLKKQEEMFSSMEQQYEVARTATHTMRGVGLGFGSFQR